MNLHVENLTKYYGNVSALSGVSFSAKAGKIVGLIGRNGAGKTTAIKCIMNIISQDSGEVTFDNTIRHKNSIGYLPEERGLYLNSTVLDQLTYFFELNDYPKSKIKSQIKKYLTKFGINEYADRKIKTLSKGNKQKVQLISALQHDPELIILDEPFSGLDPVNAELFKNVIKEEKNKGKAIILSSHRMEDIEELCDKVVILKKGIVFAYGTVDELIDKYSLGNQFHIKSNADISKLIEKNINLNLIYENNFSYLLSYKTQKNINDLQRDILNDGYEIIECGFSKATLQKIFVKELNDDEAEQ